MGNSSKKTVEFRQHEGTLDATRIITWAKLVIGFVDKARSVSTGKLLKRMLDQLDFENTNPADAWGRGPETMLRFFGGKDIETFYVNWLIENGEWLRGQVEHRHAAKTRDEEGAKTKSRERQSEETEDRTFKSSAADLRMMDKRLAQLEARQLDS